MILNKTQQQHLLELITAGIPTQRIDYGRIAEAMSDAVAKLPPPVLDYSEFTRFEKKVKTVEKMVKL